MKRLLWLGCLLLLGAGPTPTLEFLRAGHPTARVSLTQLKPLTSVRVTDPHDSAVHNYQAVRLLPLLEKVYGPQWKDEADVIFTSQDGFETSVTTAQLAAGDPWLAVASAQGPFRLNNVKQHEVVDLGPFYLIWKNAAPASHWPYQVVSIDRSRFADRYPGITPVEGSPGAVQRGFNAFRGHCIYCHSLKGQGGTSSFDLASPRNVTSYLPEDFLRAFILQPDAYHGQSKMPRYSGPATEIDDLVQYLKSFPERSP